EHHEDAAGAAQVRELVEVLVGRDAAQRVATVPGGDLERRADVVDQERDAVHADVGRPGGLGLDGVRMEVLEELEAAVAVGRLEHGDLRVVSVEADGGVRPLSAHRVPAEDRQPQVVKKSIAASMSLTAIPTFSSLMATQATVPSRSRKHARARVRPRSVPAPTAVCPA